MNIHVDNAEAPKINILLHELDVGIELLEQYQRQARHPPPVADAVENFDTSSVENKAKVSKSSARAAGSGLGVVALLRRRALSYSTAQLSFLLYILKETKKKVIFVLQFFFFFSFADL